MAGFFSQSSFPAPSVVGTRHSLVKICSNIRVDTQKIYVASCFFEDGYAVLFRLTGYLNHKKSLL